MNYVPVTDTSFENGQEFLVKDIYDDAPFVPLDKVLLGDCLELMQSIPHRSIDMILCDLPYGFTSRNEWDNVIPMAELWEQYRRIIKWHGAIVLTGQGLFSAHLMLAAPDLYKYSLVWKKNKARGHLNANKQPLRLHEDILVFYEKQPVYHPQMTFGHAPIHAVRKNESGSNYNAAAGAATKGGSTQRFPVSSIEIPVVNNDDPERVHPTQKPVALGEYLVKTFTDEGMVVLDNCCGSGAFLIAAKQLRRNYIGMDADPFFATHAENWLEKSIVFSSAVDVLNQVDSNAWIDRNNAKIIYLRNNPRAIWSPIH